MRSIGPELAMTKALPIRLLVADSSQPVRRTFREAARRWPAPVELVEAADGGACVEALVDGGIDLAFVDVAIAGLDEIAALRGMQVPPSRMFVVAMAASTRPQALGAARRLGAHDFLPKPVEPDDVTARLRACALVRRQWRGLIVDDSAVMRRLMRRIVDQSTFRIALEEAADAGQALARAAAGRPEIVFLDVNMPGRDGPAVVQELRACAPAAKLVVVSADAEHKVRSRFGAIGFDLFLGKPFGPVEVDRAIGTLFEIPVPFQTCAGRPVLE
jgi:CheY-like chemotaxis protein